MFGILLCWVQGQYLLACSLLIVLLVVVVFLLLLLQLGLSLIEDSFISCNKKPKHLGRPGIKGPIPREARGCYAMQAEGRSAGAGPARPHSSRTRQLGGDGCTIMNNMIIGAALSLPISSLVVVIS